MRLVSFAVGVVICLAIIGVGIFWISQKTPTGGGALGLGLGGLISVVYLYARRLPGTIPRPDVSSDSITLLYRVSHLDSTDTIVCIAAILVLMVLGGIIWH